MKVAFDDGWAKLYSGTALDVLRQMPEKSVHMCVTSPPYFGLRSYLSSDHPAKGQEVGTEKTPDEFVAKLVEVFAEVHRVLRDDGTCWVNIGDSYAANRTYQVSDQKHKAHDFADSNATCVPPGLKPKDLMLIPARLALALQAWDWYLRSEITWVKPNPMPESVTDRPTSSTEKVYLLSKKPRYFYDAEAVKEQLSGGAVYSGPPSPDKAARNGDTNNGTGKSSLRLASSTSRNMRNAWQITTKPYPGSHFATYPPELPMRCIKAGTSEHGVCSECGAPFKRVVEREKNPERNMEAQRAEYAASPGRVDGHIPGPGGLVDSTQTVGWSPPAPTKLTPYPQQS